MLKHSAFLTAEKSWRLTLLLPWKGQLSLVIHPPRLFLRIIMVSVIHLADPALPYSHKISCSLRYFWVRLVPHTWLPLRHADKRRWIWESARTGWLPPVCSSMCAQWVPPAGCLQAWWQPGLQGHGAAAVLENVTAPIFSGKHYHRHILACNLLVYYCLALA